MNALSGYSYCHHHLPPHKGGVFFRKKKVVDVPPQAQLINVGLTQAYGCSENILQASVKLATRIHHFIKCREEDLKQILFNCTKNLNDNKQRGDKLCHRDPTMVAQRVFSTNLSLAYDGQTVRDEVSLPPSIGKNAFLVQGKRAHQLGVNHSKTWGSSQVQREAVLFTNMFLPVAPVILFDALSGIDRSQSVTKLEHKDTLSFVAAVELLYETLDQKIETIEALKIVKKAISIVERVAQRKSGTGEDVSWMFPKNKIRDYSKCDKSQVIKPLRVTQLWGIKNTNGTLTEFCDQLAAKYNKESEYKTLEDAYVKAFELNEVVLLKRLAATAKPSQSTQSTKKIRRTATVKAPQSAQSTKMEPQKRGRFTIRRTATVKPPQPAQGQNLNVTRTKRGRFTVTTRKPQFSQA